MERASPDRAALEFAHRWLRMRNPLDEMLGNPSLKIILEIIARRHMQRRDGVDIKKLQANDKEEA